MTSFNDFSKYLRELNKNIDEDLNNIVKEMTETMLKVIIHRTPVDTSKAVSNWLVSTGNPMYIEYMAHKIGSAGSTRLESSRIAYNLGVAAILKKKSQENIYISNSVDYIKWLEGGGSKQAEPNFINNAINTVLDIYIRKYNIKINKNF